jgi:hypothetical protein
MQLLNSAASSAAVADAGTDSGVGLLVLIRRSLMAGKILLTLG